MIGNTGSEILVEILLDGFSVTPFKFWLAIESIQQTTEPILAIGRLLTKLDSHSRQMIGTL